MSHYAFVRDGRVTDVIVAEQEFIDQLPDMGTGRWIQTSYNTHAGQHALGGTPLRKNFAGMGYHYDPEADAFYPPRPYDTWILDTNTYQWRSPVPYPEDGDLYHWDPAQNTWVPMILGDQS
jgi:hypothetical protein